MATAEVWSCRDFDGFLTGKVAGVLLADGVVVDGAVQLRFAADKSIAFAQLLQLKPDTLGRPARMSVNLYVEASFIVDMRKLSEVVGKVVERSVSILITACTLVLSSAASPACAPAIDFQPRSDRYAACGLRADVAPPAGDSFTVVGTVHQIHDETPVDGPVRLVVIDPDGRPRKLYFGSLYTRPAPSELRKATYEAIATSRSGDCVHARGTEMGDGYIGVDNFVNLSRS